MVKLRLDNKISADEFLKEINDITSDKLYKNTVYPVQECKIGTAGIKCETEGKYEY